MRQDFKLSKQHFHLLNAIRGIAAILVVARHTQLLAPIPLPMSYMAVDLFFLLSGVVIAASYGDKLLGGMGPPRFMWIRVARLYPLYILGTLIGVAAFFLAGPHLMIGMAPQPITQAPEQIAAALLMLPYQPTHSMMFAFDNPAWSLFFEMAINLIYALAVPRLTNLALVVVTGLFGAGLLGSLFHFYPNVELGMHSPVEYFAGMMRAGFSFFFGVGIYRVWCAAGFGVRRSEKTMWLILFATAASLMMPHGRHELLLYIASVFFIYPCLVFFALGVETGSLTTRISDFLGNLSYAIYALHVPILMFVSSVLIVPYQKHSIISNLLVRIVYAVTLFVVAYVADKTYDKAARNWMRGLWRNRPVVVFAAGTD
jgi:peptidoglycan/LPS O-acetylase OafA/YrhL